MTAQDDLFAAPAPPPRAPHACRCEQCCPENPAPTYTEAFRHECEARYVARLPSNDQRRDYLEGPKGVLERRGVVEYYRLRAAAWACMQKEGIAA